MGKEQSKLSASSMGPVSGASKALEHAISTKELAEVQKTILLEYPFLENVYESMLLTDNRLPDCPIVFANDQFERMTLYPKEEIIGRNCRFLQGPHSNPNTIKAIRDAVHGGQPLDVEILNYRKDGVPFMNCFLMLPVHKGGNPKKSVTHFLAIQKDVTLLRPWETNPRTWSPSEVSMWLDKWGLTQEAKKVLAADVDGKQLLTKVNDAFLQSIGIDKLKARRSILEHISQIRTDPSLAYAGKSIEGSTYRAPSVDATAVDLSGARVWWNVKRSKDPGALSPTGVASSSSSSSSSSSNANTDDDINSNDESSTEDERFARMAAQNDTIAIKVYFSTSSSSNVFMELVPISIKFKKLKNLISERVRGRCRLSFFDPENELQPLQSQDDWETALVLVDNQILRIQAKVRVHKLCKSDVSLLETLGTSALVVDGGFSDVLHCNAIAKRTFGQQVVKKSVLFLFPDVDFSTLPRRSWTCTNATHQDGSRIAVSINVSETKGFLNIILVAPQLTVKPLDL